MSSHHSWKGLGALVVATVLVAASTAHALPIYDASINEGGVWTGSYTEAGGTYTIDGSGNDIWGTDDGLYFVYQEFDATQPFDFYAFVGDGGFQAIQGGLDAWAKAGIMVRQSLDQQSRNACVVIANLDTNGINPQVRRTDGANAIGTTTLKGQ